MSYVLSWRSTETSYRGSITGKGRHAEEMKATAEINAITLPNPKTPPLQVHCIMHISQVLMSTRMPYKMPNLFPPLVLKKLSPQTAIINAALVLYECLSLSELQKKWGMYRYDFTCKIKIKQQLRMSFRLWEETPSWFIPPLPEGRSLAVAVALSSCNNSQQFQGFWENIAPKERTYLFLECHNIKCTFVLLLCLFDLTFYCLPCCMSLWPISPLRHWPLSLLIIECFTSAVR